jgi:NitT/TauT family transport system ATP-binding protein
MPTPAISVEDFNVAFNGSNVYESNLNFDIQHGEFVSIIGKSGCGKTVLFKSILGNLTPSSGCIRVNNKKVEKPSKSIAVVYQDHFILPWMTLRDNITLGQSYTHTLDMLATMTGIKEHLDKLPKQVSIGTRQRASIVRALMQNTDIILMDEPLCSVDEITSDQIREEIKRLCADKTVMYITHNIREAEQLSTRIITLGKLGILADSPC